MHCLISCSGAAHLSKSLAQHLHATEITPTIRHFSSTELLVDIEQDVSKYDVVYIAQSCGHDANDKLIELLCAIDASRRSGARRIELVIPYICYGRQDRKLGDYTSVGMEIIANLLNASGADTITIVDIHSAESLKHFTIPVTNIKGIDIAIQCIDTTDKTLVMPDRGAVMRGARADAVYFEKHRNNEALDMQLHGSVNGKHCIIIDDIVDSGQTLCTAAKILKHAGAASVEAYVTHAIFTRFSRTMIDQSHISKLYVTNSIDNAALPDIATVLDLSCCYSSGSL